MDLCDRYVAEAQSDLPQASQVLVEPVAPLSNARTAIVNGLFTDRQLALPFHLGVRHKRRFDTGVLPDALVRR